MSDGAAWWLLLALHASFLGLGLLLTGWLRGTRDWPALLLYPVAYFTGALAAVLALHALLLLVDPATPTTPFVRALTAAGLLALPFGWRRRRRLITAAPAHQAARASAPATPHAPSHDPSYTLSPRAAVERWRRLDAVLALLLLPPLLLIGVQLVGLPDVSYDSVAFWNAKGAWLFHGARLDGPGAEIFTDARRLHANPDYPLYRPLLAFAQFSVLGATDDHGAKPGYLFHLLAGLALLGGLLRDAAGRRAALLALAFLLWTPIMAAAAVPGSPGTTYVDFPLGLQFAASLGWLLRALRTRAGADVAAAMLAAASATLMKNEGSIWCALLVPLGAVALLLGWSRRAAAANDAAPGSAGFDGASPGSGAARAPWAALLWLALPVAVLWGWKQVAAGMVPQIYIRPPTPPQFMRLPEVAPQLFAGWRDSLLDVRLWGLLGPVLLALCALGVLRHLRADRERLARVALAAVLLGQLCAVLLGVLLLEIQKGGMANWFAHAWDRLILQLVPSALLLAVALNTRRDVGDVSAARPPTGHRPAGR